jgi:hypothetical protein
MRLSRSLSVMAIRPPGYRPSMNLSIATYDPPGPIPADPHPPARSLHRLRARARPWGRGDLGPGIPDSEVPGLRRLGCSRGGCPGQRQRASRRRAPALRATAAPPGKAGPAPCTQTLPVGRLTPALTGRSDSPGVVVSRLRRALGRPARHTHSCAHAGPCATGVRPSYHEPIFGGELLRALASKPGIGAC